MSCTTWFGRAIEMRGMIARVDRRAATTGRVAVLCILLAGASSGCASARSAPLDGPGDAAIRVQVENRAFENATVHAIWRGRRLRLGTVIGLTTAEYKVDLESSALLRFEIDLLAGPKCATEQMWVDPGDIIVVEITPQYLNSASCLE